jgi:hypothetical protein
MTTSVPCAAFSLKYRLKLASLEAGARDSSSSASSAGSDDSHLSMGWSRGSVTGFCMIKAMKSQSFYRALGEISQVLTDCAVLAYNTGWLHLFNATMGGVYFLP